MNIQLTYDYEVFFGQQTGTVENCIIKPVNALLDLFGRYGVSATFYVDITYIARAEALGIDLSLVRQNIKQLIDNGHDVQLHIHPHWENSLYKEGLWQIDAEHFKLSDFSKDAAANIIKRCAGFFEDLTGYRAVAFRAGGWCLQPFSHIDQALYDVGIRVDSTIYTNGINYSSIQGFDFSSAPERNLWLFDEDPLVESKGGRFLELPISDISVSPLFFWKFAFAKKMGGEVHKSFGDGGAIPMSKKQMIKLLTFPSTSVASLDGYKSTLLEKSYVYRKKKYGDKADLVFIGHPKSLTLFSLSLLENFIKKHIKRDRFCTVSQRYHELATNIGQD